MTERPNLRVVDADGVLHDLTDCPLCTEREQAIVQLERQVRTLSARITRLQRDEEAAARRHKLWAEAQTVHDWWKLATGHFGVRFAAEEFHQAAPRLKQSGPIPVLKAIAGAAYDPGTTTMKNGRTKRYDDFELIMRTDAKLRAFIERAPGEADSEEWKLWLVRRIEANLTSNG